jgi:hypothetical protein
MSLDWMCLLTWLQRRCKIWIFAFKCSSTTCPKKYFHALSIVFTGGLHYHVSSHWRGAVHLLWASQPLEPGRSGSHNGLRSCVPHPASTNFKVNLHSVALFSRMHQMLSFVCLYWSNSETINWKGCK